MKRWYKALVVISVLFLTACGTTATPPDQTAGTEETVGNVVDGDAIDVLIGATESGGRWWFPQAFLAPRALQSKPEER